MRIAVTGASGFVGRHLVARLLEGGHELTAIGRNKSRMEQLPSFHSVRFVESDIRSAASCIHDTLGANDVLVHLAWDGLPNYKGLFHFEKNLPEAYDFVKSAVLAGYKRIVVVGTCFEYGMVEGCLSEDSLTCPANPYGIAKDTLRKYLQLLQLETPFELSWCRLFYMYGPGQNPKSLFSQLEAAIARKDARFPMSGGEQLRDFLPVAEVADRLRTVIEHPSADGVFNICSGKPVSIRSLVEKRIQELGAKIELDLGVYPYPTYEPFAFWGNPNKFLNLKKERP